MKKLFFLTAALALIISCESDDSTPITTPNNPDQVDPTPDPVDPAPDPVVTINSVRLRSDATFGTVLMNSDGFTLYFFAHDSKGDSNCSGGCIATWPAFYAENLTLDDGLNVDDFNVITREDGSQQNTFKGWPLYLFANDSETEQISGDGSGDVWFVAKPDYTVMLAKAQLLGRDSDGNENNLTSTYELGDENTNYMTDANGNTLYAFINDTNEKNNFTANDFSNNGIWPIFEESFANVPSIFDSENFNSIDVFGRQQLTYKGWPLYYFVQDENRGDNYGVGFPSAGIWPIVNTSIDEAPAAETEVSSKTYTVGNQGASAYTFSGEGLTEAVNPDFTLKRGDTYEFVVNTPGHPFYINSVQGTSTQNAYNDGVTNNGASTGTITFIVPLNAPDTLFYNCEFHGAMTGTFSIID